MKGTITSNEGESRYRISVDADTALLQILVAEKEKRRESTLQVLFGTGGARGLYAREAEYARAHGDALQVVADLIAAMNEERAEVTVQSCLTARLNACDAARSASLQTCRDNAVACRNGCDGSLECLQACDDAEDACEDAANTAWEVCTAQANLDCVDFVTQRNAEIFSRYSPRIATAQAETATALAVLQSARRDIAFWEMQRAAVDRALTELREIEARGIAVTCWAAQYDDALTVDTEVEVAQTPSKRHVVTAVGESETCLHDARAVPAFNLFVNSALNPGVETWRPRWRTGIVKEINDDGTLKVEVTGGEMSGTLGTRVSRREINCTPPQAYFDEEADIYSTGEAQRAYEDALQAWQDALAARDACYAEFASAECQAPLYESCAVALEAVRLDCLDVRAAGVEACNGDPGCLAFVEEQYQACLAGADAAAAQCYQAADDQCALDRVAHVEACDAVHTSLIVAAQAALTEAETALANAIAMVQDPASPLVLDIDVAHCKASSYQVDDEILIHFPARSASAPPAGSSSAAIRAAAMTVWSSARVVGWATEPRPCGGFACFQWLPEGIVITPRTADAPHGYGSPRRDPVTAAKINAPYGTVIANADNVALNQCLINRKPGNNYLDDPQYITGTNLLQGVNRRLAETYADQEESDSAYQAWPQGDQPSTCAGDGAFWSAPENIGPWSDIPSVQRLSIGSEVFHGASGAAYQFTSDRLPVITEPDGEAWVGHWPEELLYDSQDFESIFLSTNEYRVAADQVPVTRPLRGMASPALMGCAEVQRAGILAHDSVLYRPGRETAQGRAMGCADNIRYTLENLYLGTPTSPDPEVPLTPEMTGTIVAEAWRDSPGHYVAMVSEEFSSPPGASSLDVFGGVPATITEAGDPNPQVFDPPVSGLAYAQVLSRRVDWLWVGTAYQQTPYGRVTWGALNDYGPDLGPQHYIGFRGRRYTVQPAATPLVRILIGATVFERAGALWLRVLLFFPAVTPPQLRSYAVPLAIAETCSPWPIEHTSAGINTRLGSMLSFMTTASFTQDGAHAVFTAVLFNQADPIPYHYPWTNPDPGVINYDFKPLDYAVAAIIDFDAEDGFSIRAEYTAQPMTFAVTESGNDLVEYRQTATGSFEFGHHYREDDQERVLTHTLDLDIRNSIEASHWKQTESLTFPSGKVFSLVSIDIEDHAFQGDNFFTMILAIDMKTEDVCWVKITLEQDVGAYANYAKATADIYVNDTFVKTLGSVRQAFSGGHRPIGNSVTGDNAYAFNFYWCDRFRDNYEGLSLDVAPKYETGGGGSWCGSVTTRRFRQNGLPVGSTYVDLRARTANGPACIITPVTALAGYTAHLPILTGGSDVAGHEEGVCTMARYHDALVVSGKIVNLGNRWVPDEDDRDFFWSSIPLEDITGLSDLTSIHPALRV